MIFLTQGLGKRTKYHVFQDSWNLRCFPLRAFNIFLRNSFKTTNTYFSYLKIVLSALSVFFDNNSWIAFPDDIEKKKIATVCFKLQSLSHLKKLKMYSLPYIGIQKSLNVNRSQVFNHMS